MGPVRSVVVVSLVVGLVASTSLAAGAGTVSVGPAATSAQSLETDNTVTRIALQPDGDARWTVQVRTRLETDADAEEYRTFQTAFRENTSRFRDPFEERMNATVADAATVTGREMVARTVTASTSIQEVPRRWGVVTFSFTWTNFAERDGDALVVGDVFEGGFFLAANDTLVVEAPANYAIESADPQPTSDEGDAVTWEGRVDFADRRPQVVVSPTDAVTSPDGASTTGNGDAGVDGWVMLVGGLLAVVVALGALHLAGFRFPTGDWRRSAGSGSDDEGVVGGDAPVLTDPERVEALLEDSGGRMKQSALADELGWTASKTSRVVGGMVEEERVEKLRVGRENLVDLLDD